jgi:hypothetical protein
MTEMRSGNEPGYPAARIVAPAVEAYFGRALRGAQESSGASRPPPPLRADIEAIVDVSFWASLRREEGRSPRVSITYLAPEMAAAPLRFARPLPFTAAALTHLAPAVERPGIHLGVWRDGEDLFIWGTTRTVPCFCFVLEVVEPGLLVIKYRRGEDTGKFKNVAVLQGDEVRIIDREGRERDENSPSPSRLLGFLPMEGSEEPVNAFVELAVSMRGHGRGGSLLVVPAESDRWRESIVRPISYAVDPPLAELAELMALVAEQRHEAPWRSAFDRAVAAVAGLTAVDGAAVISDSFDVHAFGAKIGRREGYGSVEEVMVTEPVLGRTVAVVHPATLGGTRHLSAAQFVHDQRDAFAMVASQDGRFTIFAWSPHDERVRAHRVEALLL